MNLAALVVSFPLLMRFAPPESVGLQVLALPIMTVIALVFGWHLVASIGGADMPVVVSMLPRTPDGLRRRRALCEHQPVDRDRCAGGSRVRSCLTLCVRR
ncbi:NAD(P)(+) transhydrogenase (Re/Si-specific) subunit beta [Shigella flexneri]